MSRLLWSLLVSLALISVAGAAHATPLKVGSKRFTESYVLAEITIALARKAGIEAVHEQGLGGTAVTYRALEEGAVDIYPEYTGTIVETILRDGSADVGRIRAALAERHIGTSESIGFQNTYALAISRATSTRTGLARMSELVAHPELRFALSHEFAGRRDGWRGLSVKYGISERSIATIDHALAYEALKAGRADITDVYTTDAKIARFDLVVLDDDAHFFPPYEAVLLFRLDALTRFPNLAGVLSQMAGSIDVIEMRNLNARAELDRVPFSQVAAEHLGMAAGHSPTRAAATPSFLTGLVTSIERHGPRHVELVFGSLLLSTLIGVPLGILAYSARRVGGLILGISGVLQTIPSLALFCFFVPILGIGWGPALAALFLYGLLPIVRNTHAGLSSIPTELRSAGLALGLSPFERMRHVELPLASRTILAGIKTSAVVAVGSATIAAFIGAGGFGDPISTGLSLNDVPTILDGAIPAAGLALVVQGLFALIERALVPAGLRHQP